jgi:hypothetical protein
LFVQTLLGNPPGHEKSLITCYWTRVAQRIPLWPVPSQAGWREIGVSMACLGKGVMSKESQIKPQMHARSQLLTFEEQDFT